MFSAQMPKYGNLGPDPQNLDILGNFLYDSNHLDNTLQMSPQQLSGDKLKPNYVQKGVCGPECPNMVIRPQTPKFGNFLKISCMTLITLSIRFQWALNQYQGIILPQVITMFPIFRPLSPLRIVFCELSTLFETTGSFSLNISALSSDNYSISSSLEKICSAEFSLSIFVFDFLGCVYLFCQPK